MDRAAALTRLHEWNPWWKGGAPEVPPFRRDAFPELERLLGQPKAVLLTGLRQTGKTTLLLQLVSSMPAAERNRCCYLPLDQADPQLERWNATLEDVVRLWSEEIAQSPLGRGPTKFVFLDECQFHPDWARQVKGLLDRRSPIRFLITGSAATTLQEEAARLLAGRAILHALGPMTLRELLRARLDPERVRELLRIGDDCRELASEAVRAGAWDARRFRKLTEAFAPWRGEVAALTARLLERGGFPEIALSEMHVPAAHRLLRTFLTLLVQRDFVQFFHVRDTRTLERLIELLAQGTGRILVERRLASDLGVAINTLRNHLGFLENSCLIRTLRAHVESAARAARLPEKFHFADPGLRAALVGGSPEDRGFLLDSLLHGHLAAWVERDLPGAKLTYWRQGDREVDLVLGYGRRLAGIEVHAAGTEPAGLRAFRERHPKSMSWIVSEGTTGRLDTEVAELPLGLMLLLA
ncbi:MAG: ATP-binding protein [Planctomycetes bacterium]|nr:ATP-binding protein [Planctomycetota bacterium]